MVLVEVRARFARRLAQRRLRSFRLRAVGQKAVNQFPGADQMSRHERLRRRDVSAPDGVEQVRMFVIGFALVLGKAELEPQIAFAAAVQHADHVHQLRPAGRRIEAHMKRFVARDIERRIRFALCCLAEPRHFTQRRSGVMRNREPEREAFEGRADLIDLTRFVRG